MRARHILPGIIFLTVAAATAATPESSPASADPISATMTARNAGSAQWFFAMAPDDVLPLLPANTRLDMLDYYNSGVHRESADASGARAVVTGSSDRSLRFEVGDTCRFEIDVFPAGSDTLVALIETIAYPMRDSRIQWFDARWQPVRKALEEPSLADWLTPDGRKHRAEVEEMNPFITYEATADAARGVITLRNTMETYFLPQDRADAIGNYMHPELVYRLKGKRFVR